MIRCGFIILLLVQAPLCTARFTTDSPAKEYIDSFPATSDNFLQVYPFFYPRPAFNIHDGYKTLPKQILALLTKKLAWQVALLTTNWQPASVGSTPFHTLVSSMENVKSIAALPGAELVIGICRASLASGGLSQKELFLPLWET